MKWRSRRRNEFELEETPREKKLDKLVEIFQKSSINLLLPKYTQILSLSHTSHAKLNII